MLHGYFTVVRSVLTLGSVLLGYVSPAVAGAQQLPLRSASVTTGVAYFDSRGEGYSPTLALRVDQSFARAWLVAEGGVAYMPLRTPFAADRTNLMALDAQLQLQLPFSRVRPYVGIGGGAMMYLSNPDSDGRVTQLATVSAGVRVPVRAGWSFRGDTRLALWERARQTNDAFTHGAAGVALGVARDF